MAKAKVPRVQNAPRRLVDGPLTGATMRLSPGCEQTLTFTAKGRTGWYDARGYFHETASR